MPTLAPGVPVHARRRRGRGRLRVRAGVGEGMTPGRKRAGCHPRNSVPYAADRTAMWSFREVCDEGKHTVEGTRRRGPTSGTIPPKCRLTSWSRYCPQPPLYRQSQPAPPQHRAMIEPIARILIELQKSSRNFGARWTCRALAHPVACFLDEISGPNQPDAPGRARA